jgi:membrane protease YdiL (CAAX protease family)
MSVRVAAERVRADRLPLVLAFALMALASRVVGTWSFVVPLLGAAGVLAAQPRAARGGAASSWIGVTAAGVLAIAAVRVALPGVPAHATVLGLLACVAAAIGEEIVFRRGLYGALERWGPLVAVVVSAFAFGVVHVPMYGWAVVPVDVGAGLLFGWQRWVTGGWTSSAVTHTAANLLGGL